ncbi:hypothetical protein E8D34_17060 [Nocardioides sp. GY 10113]|uniref:HAD domain-containing protein n=1 Tax=Nocardioides sp. GY 10113 TaxID=2569761 RepID=UPI0010A894B4|nr:HAD domain-containing protein [Nocardioides sp. GY 10113]TIC82194.1 hypothetical protein E8D34_17060 [Nocardioides sp. GY 10113]
MSDRIPLLVDVDGVLNVLLPRGAGGQVDTRRLDVHEGVLGPDGRAFTLRFDPRLPTWLDRLSERFELVWSTTWSNANEAISPLVGLPGDLDQVRLPRGDDWIGVAPYLCRKTVFVRRWAAERGVARLAWIDDEIVDADRAALTATWPRQDRAPMWMEGYVNTPALDDATVVTTDPLVGLTEEQVDTLMAWAESRSGRLGAAEAGENRHAHDAAVD